jgi:two-component system, chemotaxis family, CheB/CheR fusion protein
MSFPIVGIGASAGGIHSFCKIIKRVPANTGMAYILVQHLNPKHSSHLVKAISKRAALPVEEALEGVKIFPDRLYVIAPNTALTVDGDILHARSCDPAESPYLPVDLLFHSLAEQRGPNVIGIILSGCGSDGVSGIQAIKQAGGITFAQYESFAFFFGMPGTAVQTGCVDFILSPGDIAQGLLSVGQWLKKRPKSVREKSIATN